MFAVGDKIVYGSSGICEIIDETENTIAGIKREYFVLKPDDLDQSSIFVPKENEKLLSRMRNIHTRDELKAIVKQAKKETDEEWIENTNERQTSHREIIQSGDALEIIKLIRKINIITENGTHRVSKSDERTFKNASRVLLHEFSYILDVDINEMLEIIL